MELKTIVWIAAVLMSFALGYLGAIKFKLQKTNGDIVYEIYKDENDQDAVRCTFKMDMDVDDIVREDYILLGVKKDQKVLDFYKNI